VCIYITVIFGDFICVTGLPAIFVIIALAVNINSFDGTYEVCTFR